jgi:Leucine-rich repeat (LRR) protein/PKD repeat protein
MKVILRYLLIVFVLCQGTQQVVAQGLVPDSVERAVLLALYDSTNGANWGLPYRWKVLRIQSYPHPDSTLYGIQVENGDITSIQLSSVGMNGSIPEALEQLGELRYLSFYNNRFLTGPLPELDGLQKIINFDVGYTNLSGSIPEWLGDLPLIQNLNLSSYPGDAQFSGPIPVALTGLSTLRSLYLTNNNLSQVLSIPDEFSQLDNLQSLDLQSCGLNPSSISNGLTGLSALNNLNLSSNALAIPPDSLFPDILRNLPALTTLMLQNVPFRYLPGTFPELTNLNYLNLGSNNYSDLDRISDIVDTLRNCTSLRTLILQSCNLPGLPDNFHTLSTVENLYLSNNPLQNDNWDDIGGMPALRSLYVQSCNLNELPQTLTNINTLETLYASNNQLYPIPLLIRDIPNLKHLYLMQNGIQALPGWIGSGNMNELLTLDMSFNQIPLPLPDSMRFMIALRHLNLGNNLLAGVVPDSFADLASLNTLDLRNNQITSPLPDLSGLTQLNNIYLQNNMLSGAVPAFLSNTTVPKNNVNISFNRFDEMTPFVASPSLTIIVNNNKLTFRNILKVQRPVASYIYVPQDTVEIIDGQTEAEAYIGGTLTITANVDRDTDPPSHYQWFRYVDGVNDIPLAGPSAGDSTYNDLNFAPGEEGKYYYKITNPAAPGLSLISPIIRVRIKPCITDAPVDFTHKKYVCAITFEPAADSQNCRAISFSWNFGDGKTSSVRRPVHGYEDAGTYMITLTLRYRCGTICELDTTIQKEITFNPNDALFTDTTITVGTDIREDVIATSAGSFSDSWPLQYETSQLDSYHGYEKAVEGVWRSEGAYVYNVPRSRAAETNISKDGTFDVEHFNWQQADLSAIPHWVKANTITQYSSYSYELENQDVLGVYSAALYDYGGHLPSANGVNMRFSEMAFTSFEFLGGGVSGNWIFGNQPRDDYQLYDVHSGYKNTAIVKASMRQLDEVEAVDVRAKRLFIFNTRQTRYTENDSLICMQHYPQFDEWSVIVLRDAPFDGVWGGQIKVNTPSASVPEVNIDDEFAHSGRSSLRITAAQTFRQNLLHLDSGKRYVVNVWVSVDNEHVSTPFLASDLGVAIRFLDKDHQLISDISFEPSGPVIEGWQQVRGTFTCPIRNAVVEIQFKPGSTGTAWYDDLRLHPEKGNMKTYVYDLEDYRLRAILDEENFASFFYYDAEGNLYLTKKETTRGMKTIGENISYQKDTNSGDN